MFDKSVFLTVKKHFFSQGLPIVESVPALIVAVVVDEHPAH